MKMGVCTNIRIYVCLVNVIVYYEHFIQVFRNIVLEENQVSLSLVKVLSASSWKCLIMSHLNIQRKLCQGGDSLIVIFCNSRNRKWTHTTYIMITNAL